MHWKQKSKLPDIQILEMTKVTARGVKGHRMGDLRGLQLLHHRRLGMGGLVPTKHSARA